MQSMPKIIRSTQKLDKIGDGEHETWDDENQRDQCDALLRKDESVNTYEMLAGIQKQVLDVGAGAPCEAILNACVNSSL